MSLRLLEENWNSIVKKVIEPLWEFKFKSMYISIKFDKSDFESLAGLELTKAFMSYNPKESDIYTYAHTVILRKAKTEIRNKKRDKRMADIVAESIYQKVNEETNKTLEDVIKNIVYPEIKDLFDVEITKMAVYSLLKPKERKIIELSINGLENKDIAELLRMNIKDIVSVKKKLSETSSVRKVLRISGYLGGLNNEI